MTKKEMLEDMLADMVNEYQKKRFMARGMRKSKEQIMNIYNHWQYDPDNSKFYHAIING